MGLQPGEVIDGKYRIVRLLGEGGMGAVYEGENVLIHRRVAIKILHAHIAEKGDLVQRFEREAQAAGRIGSEHIVEVLDLGALPNGDRFMVMEFLEGEALSDRMQSCGRMLPGQIFPILIELLEGLGAAHKAGIVHRDLKPDNVFLMKERAKRADFVKIVDFGVSKFNPLNTEEASMTQTGAVMGTPYYMSPEQAKGSRDLDGRSDLFSVGVILYEAVTGRVPFDAETFNELIFKIALSDPPPPEQVVPDLDQGVGAIIRKALARDPNHRFASAAVFSEAIQEWLRTGRVVSVPPPAGVALASGPGGQISTGTQMMGAPPPFQHTGPPVTHSQPGIAKRSGGSIAALAVIGTLCVVGLGGGAYFFLGAAPASDAEPAAAVAESDEEAVDEPDEEDEEATEDDAADDDGAEETDSETDETDSDGADESSEEGEASSEEEVAEPAAAPPASPAGPKPPVAAAPPPSDAAPPAGANHGTTEVGGRQIREDL